MTIQEIRLGRILLAAAAALAFALPVQSQDFPARLVRVVVPFPAGSLTDTLARIVAEKLQGKWGQPVIVENRAGAGGNVGAEVVARAAPDGHTLVFAPPSPFVTNKLFTTKLAPIAPAGGADVSEIDIRCVARNFRPGSSTGLRRAGGPFGLRSRSRVAERGYPHPAPSEPCMGLSIHTAQASTKASFDTRLHHCVLGLILMPTAIEMVHLEIACRIRPALRCFHNTANIPRGALCD